MKIVLKKMVMTKVKISFRREKMKLFCRTIGLEIVAVSACALMIGVVLVFWRWLKFDAVPDLTNQDLAEFTRLDLHYRISGWWELLFVWLWGILIYLIGSSRHLKAKLGSAMKIIFLILVIGFGLYFAIAYHGALYGFSASLFLTFLPPLLLFIYFLWRKMKVLFSRDSD